MCHRANIVCALLGSGLLLTMVGSAPAQDMNNLVLNIFQEHYGRRPTGMELNNFANVASQSGLLEGLINLFGSDDYFFTRCGGNYETYVTNVFRTFLHREPRSDETRYWVGQFRRRIPRTTTLRQFCQIYQVTQLPSVSGGQPDLTLPTEPVPISGFLVNHVDLMISTIEGKLAGTALGRRLVAASQRLRSAAMAYRQLVASPNSDPQQVLAAVENMEVAAQGVEAEFNRVPGAIDECDNVRRVVSRLVANARAAPPRPPATPKPPVPSDDFETLREVSRRFAASLERYQNVSPAYAYLWRDAQGLSAQIDALLVLVRAGVRGPRLEAAFAGVQNTAVTINGKMNRTDAGLQRAWWNVQYQISKCSRALGIQPELYSEPGAPVVMNRPLWGQLPTAGSPTGRPTPRNQDLVDLTDSLIAKIDSLTATVQPITENRAVAALATSLQDLKHEARSFRQAASAGGYGSKMRYNAEALVGDYKRANAAFVAAVATAPAMYSPVFQQIGEDIARIQQTVRQ